MATIQQLSDAGRYQECLQACQQLLKSEPENQLPWKFAGKSLLALGQFEKGQQFLLKSHELDTSDPEIMKDIGNIFLNLGNKDEALKWYQKALEINNSYAPALNNIANLKRQSGNHQEAIELYKQAIQADPKLIQAYVGVAASFLALGDFDQAESFAAKALAINESTPGANEILGGIFQNKSNHDQAIEYYQKELKIHPKASNSLLNLGLLLLQKGQTASAVESLIKASTLAPSEQCSLLLAQAYQNLGQFEEAIIEYKKLDINMSKNKIIPFNFGLCLLNTGNNIDAIKAFKIAIQLDELFIPAWGNIGIALTNEGKHREALPATQKVLELDPNNLTALINLGEIYKVLGQLDQALAATLKSLELKPDNPDVLINLGGIYKDLGQLDQALAVTLKSLELKPDNPDVLINLGGIYKDLGQLDQALAVTLKSLELKPDNPGALMNLGIIFKDLGQLDQALAATLKSLELKPADNISALNNLTIFLQTTRENHSKEEINPIKFIDTRLRELSLPGNLNSRIELNAVRSFIRKALDISNNLDENIFTGLSQIYCRNNAYLDMDCKSYMKFFNAYDGIASRCHHCYKVQAKVDSLDELVALHLFFKRLNLSSNNIRKCIVELRKEAQGLFKGLIYCSSFEEAIEIKNYISKELNAMTDLSPCISIKRGCTEFSIMHKAYGDIGTNDQPHEGRKQPEEWGKLEKKYLRAQNVIKDSCSPTSAEFNLGELLIIKNWIFYAQMMGDLSAISEYDLVVQHNDEFKKMVIDKKLEILSHQSTTS